MTDYSSHNLQLTKEIKKSIVDILNILESNKSEINHIKDLSKNINQMSVLIDKMEKNMKKTERDINMILINTQKTQKELRDIINRYI